MLWDIKAVLNFVKANWGKSRELSLKHLTYKLLLPLTLSITSRMSPTRNLDIYYVEKTEGKYIFYLDKFHENEKQGYSLKVMISTLSKKIEIK